jgi:hypothetical protein
MLCEKEQRVATIVISPKASNIIIKSPKATNVIMNHVQRNGKEVLLINCYFPPRLNIEEILATLTETLNRVKEAIPTLIVGDFNVRHTKWGDTLNAERGDELWDFMDERGFQTLNEQDIHITFDRRRIGRVQSISLYTAILMRKQRRRLNEEWKTYLII